MPFILNYEKFEDLRIIEDGIERLLDYPFKVHYNNDVGPMDDYFDEWWEVLPDVPIEKYDPWAEPLMKFKTKQEAEDWVKFFNALRNKLR